MDSPVSYLAPACGTAPAPAACVREAGAAPAQPRLLDRVRFALRLRHYSRRTEDAYVALRLFHGKRHPADMGATELTGFLSSLAVDRRVAASTQNQALSALLFLYRDVLELDRGSMTSCARSAPCDSRWSSPGKRSGRSSNG